MALAGITRHDIAQWARDELITLDHWERRALLDIDQAYVRLIGGAELDDGEGEA